MKTVIWIRDETVIAIHRRQLKEYGGMEGIRDQGLLQSALYRPKNLLAYSASPPDLSSLAAAYAWGLVKNHPFVDGNKRSGAFAFVWLLEKMQISRKSLSPAALTALTILVAKSQPQEKEKIIGLIEYLL